MTSARVSREHVETLVKIVPNARISRLHVETLHSPNLTIIGGRVTGGGTVRAGVTVLTVVGTRVTETGTVRTGSLLLGTTITGTRVTEAATVRTGSITVGPVTISGGLVAASGTVRTGAVYGSAYISEFKVPAVQVSANATAFVTRVDLSQASDLWWGALNDNGVGSIRIRKANVDIPFHVVWIDAGLKQGELYFRSNLVNTSDNVFTIEVVQGASAPAATDPIGRNAVWQDYGWAGSWFEDGIDYTGNGNDAVIVGTVASEFGPVVSANNNGNWFQGVAFDGTYWYGDKTNELRKYNSAFVQQAINSDPVGASGIPGANHCGDIAVMGGELYVPIGKYPPSGPNNQHIGVFNISDLSFNREYDISGNGHDVPCIIWNADEACWVVGTFDGPTDPNVMKLYKYDTSWNLLGTVTLPAVIPYKQGIAWKSGFYYIMSAPTSGGGVIWKVATDMSTAIQVWTSGGAEKEGMELVGNDLYFISTGGVNTLYKLPYLGTLGEVGWLTLASAGNAEVGGLPAFTNWTMGATVKLSALPTANGAILSYSNNSTTDGNRATLMAQDGPDRFALWDSGGFLAGPTITSADVGVRRRLHRTQNNTTDRKIWFNGALSNTGLTPVQRPAGGTPARLFIGAEDLSYNERINAKIGGIIYLRNGVLTPEWLDMEERSWEGSSFVAFTPEGDVFSGTRITGAGTARAGSLTFGAITKAGGRVAESGAARHGTLLLGGITRSGTRVSSVEAVRTGFAADLVIGTRVFEVASPRTGVTLLGAITRSGVRVLGLGTTRHGVMLLGTFTVTGTRVAGPGGPRTGTVILGNVVKVGARVVETGAPRTGVITQEASTRIHLEIRIGGEIHRVRIGRRVGSEIQWLSGAL